MIPADRLRAVVALLGNDDLTPHAQRLLLQLCDTCDTCDERQPVSPDCGQRKCTACSGDAWDLTGDRPAHCACRCHDQQAVAP